MSPTSHPLARPLRAVAAAVALLLAVLALAACGEDEKAASSTELSTVAPADAIAYGEVLVRPSGEVGEGVRAALRRIVRVDDPGAELRRFLDEETDDGERDVYTRMIEPWLGDTVAAFALDGGAGRPPEWALAIDASSADDAEQMVRNSLDDGDLERGGAYEGVEYALDPSADMTVGVLESVVVAGTMEGFRAAVDASKGRSLADDAEFARAADSVPDDRLAWGYLDGRALATLIEESGATADPSVAAGLDELDLDGIGTAVVSLTMRADEIVLEAEGDGIDDVVGGGDEDVTIEDLPADAWLAFAGPFAASQLRRQLDGAGGGYDRALGQIRAMTGLDLERDLLSWISGIGMFLRGTSPLDLGIGLVAGSSDEQASQRFVARLERLVGGLGLDTTPTVGGGGFQARIPDFPQPLVVLARGDRVAIAIGLATARDAIDPPQRFGEEEPARSAIASIGDDYRTDFVLTVDPLLSILANFGAASDPDVAEVLPYLSAYRSIATGTKEQDGRTAFKLVIGLQEPDEDPGE